MKNKFCYLLFLGIPFVFSFCAKPKVSVKELTKFLNDEKNGLIKQEETAGLIVRAKYISSQLMVNDQLQGPDKVNRDSLEKIYADYIYIQLSLSQNGKEHLRASSDFSSYAQALREISFHMSEHVYLTTSAKDTIPLADYSYIPTYGLGNQTLMLLAFPKKDKEASFDLNCVGLVSGLKKLEFKFSAEDIHAIPVLDYGSI